MLRSLLFLFALVCAAYAVDSDDNPQERQFLRNIVATRTILPGFGFGLGGLGYGGLGYGGLGFGGLGYGGLGFGGLGYRGFFDEDQDKTATNDATTANDHMDNTGPKVVIIPVPHHMMRQLTRGSLPVDEQFRPQFPQHIDQQQQQRWQSGQQQRWQSGQQQSHGRNPQQHHWENAPQQQWQSGHQQHRLNTRGQEQFRQSGNVDLSNTDGTAEMKVRLPLRVVNKLMRKFGQNVGDEQADTPTSV